MVTLYECFQTKSLSKDYILLLIDFFKPLYYCTSFKVQIFIELFIILLLNRACDSCEEWYHGDCIGVTQVDARCIKKYFCDACRG